MGIQTGTEETNPIMQELETEFPLENGLYIALPGYGHEGSIEEYILEEIGEALSLRIPPVNVIMSLIAHKIARELSHIDWECTLVTLGGASEKIGEILEALNKRFHEEIPIIEKPESNSIEIGRASCRERG